MQRQQFDRFLDEDENSLLEKVPFATNLDEALRTFAENNSEKDTVKELDANAQKMRLPMVKKIKAYIERMRAFGYSDEIIERKTKEKFRISIYESDNLFD